MPGLPSGDLVKLLFGGTLYGSETWSVGLWFRPNLAGGTPTPAQNNTAALACLNRFNSEFWNAGTNPWKFKCSTGTSLNFSKLYWYHDAVLFGAGTGAITAVPGTGSSPAPAYQAAVVTLQTDLPGRSHRGRLYLPATGIAVNASTGLMPSGGLYVSNLATAVEDMIGLDFGPYGGPSWVVCSTHLSSTAPITSIRMDNRPDTQRGRDKKIVPSVFDSHSFP